VAKALQCPECGERHPLDEVVGTTTFRCRECGRLLKVPAEALSAVGVGGRADAPTKATGRVPPSERDAGVASETANGQGRLPPSERGVPLRAEPSRRAVSTVPRVVRMIVWVVAMPAGLLPVAVVARITGALSVDAAADIFIGVGWGRFVPVLLILPVWAAVSATLAHLTIEGLGRLLRTGE
jgi:hypothetical protein